jgi:hypothetical protein
MDVNKLILTVLEGGMVVTALYNEQQQKKVEDRSPAIAKEHSKVVPTRSCSCLQ